MQFSISLLLAMFTHRSPLGRPARSQFQVILAMLASCLLLAGLLPMAESQAGKGSKGNGGGTLPPVQYRLSWLGSFGGSASYVSDMNDAGVVVGSATKDGLGYAYRVVPRIVNGRFVYWDDADEDGVNDLMEDLNSIITNWIDLGDGGTPATGWRTNWAYGINQFGDIVGTAVNSETGDRRAFHFNPLNSRISLLPTVGNGEHRGTAINDVGTIVGLRNDGVSPFVVAILYRWDPALQTYLGTELVEADLRGRTIDINNAGQMVVVGAVWGTGYRLTPQSDGSLATDFYEDLAPLAINEKGVFCGSMNIPRKRFREDASFRYSDVNGLEVLQESRQPDAATGINSAADVCMVGERRRGFLWWENDPASADDNILLPLDDLVVGTDLDLLQWYDATFHILPQAITSRDLTGFGQIGGTAWLGGVSYAAFVLTPVPL